MYTTEFWIKSEEVQSIAFQEYWNNELIEKSKEWYIVDGNFNVMEQYLVKSGLLGSLAESKKYINDILHTDISGVCVDVAAGNMWAVKHLLEFGKISKVYAVEYSKHRLLKLGPLVLEHYNINPDNVILAYGSFYDIKLPDNSVDVVFASQSFHHADDPMMFLHEMKRILKDTGIIIMIGEHKINSFIAPKSDADLGDHYYTLHNYAKMFKNAGFSWHIIRCKSNKEFTSFVLVNKNENFFLAMRHALAYVEWISRSTLHTFKAVAKKIIKFLK